MQLVMQPCGDSDAIRHYIETIENPVPLARILPFLPESERDLVLATFGEAAAVWGVTPGKNNINANKWLRMQLGDIVLLYRDKRFFFKGEVAYKIHAPELARELWQERTDGTTWEYVFFLTGLEQVDINIVRFNAAAKYKPNNIIQGFNVLNSVDSEAIIEALELELTNGAMLLTASQVQAAKHELEKLQGDLDLPANARRRAEQALLRKIFLGGKEVETCSICSKVLPVNFLVIGHIRKRHSCDPDQKRDPANVMPVCLLGCDKLFEDGYIHVDASGVIRTAHTNSHLEAVINSLTGKACRAWTPASAPYFKWHEERRRKAL